MFLSHASADKPAVETLAGRLADEAGLRPFLARWHLVPGEPWQEALEEALGRSASCAVFLGPGGLGPWENEEMRAALDERVSDPSFRVVPVLLAGADPADAKVLPRFLRRLTWVDFRSGLDDPDAFQRLVAGIRGETPGRGARPRADARRVPRMPAWLLCALPTFVLAAALIGLAAAKAPTPVVLDLTLRRVSFVVGDTEADWVSVLDVPAARNVTFERFATVTFEPSALLVADPGTYDLAAGRYPESAWHVLAAVAPAVVLTAADAALQPSATFAAAERAEAAVDSLTARAGSMVTLDAIRSDATLSAAVERKPSRAALSFSGPFELGVEHAHLVGVAELPYDTDSLTYRVRLGRSPNVDVVGRDDALVIVADMPAGGGDLLRAADVPVRSLDFTRQDDAGNRVSALAAAGTLRYPGTSAAPVTLDAADAVSADGLESFRIADIGWDSEHGALRLRAAGVAGSLRTGSPGAGVDRRLTRLEDLRWRHPFSAVAGLIAWLSATILALHRSTKARRR